MLLILAENTAFDGTLLAYRPARFTVWARGAWARDSWGMNDEFTTGGETPSGGGSFARRRIGALAKQSALFPRLPRSGAF